jgi:bile acid:Na+ symporter, BASS family
MTAAELVTPVSLALLVAMAITAGLKVKVEDVVGAFRRTRPMILGLVLNFLIIPAVAIGLIQVLDAPPLVAAGVLIMAVCPGAPFALPGTAVARGDVPFAVGLMVANVVLSVVLAPLLLGLLLGGIPGAEDLKIDYPKIILTLLASQLVPLGLALWFHRRYPERAGKLARPMEIVQNLLVVAVVVVGLLAQYKSLGHLTLTFFLGFYLLFAAGLVGGWLLGGPDKGVRKAMAFSSPQRNSGVAMVIAAANFPATPAVAVSVVFAVLLTLTGLAVQFAMRKL